jgi:hypothetical protein
MNCTQYQQKIIDSLATGEHLLAAEVVAHQNSCVACSEFYESQRSLFQRIDAGLRSLVNQPVPPSLLSTARVRLEQKPGERSVWTLRWSLGAVVATAILVVGLGYALRRPGTAPDSPSISSVASRSVDSPQAPTQRAQTLTKVLPTARIKHPLPSASSLTAPKVIVSAEERQAFAKFVAEVPEEKEVALALAQPAPPAADAPVEIALLQIAEVEVKPLDGTPRE